MFQANFWPHSVKTYKKIQQVQNTKNAYFMGQQQVITTCKTTLECPIPLDNKKNSPRNRAVFLLGSVLALCSENINIL